MLFIVLLHDTQCVLRSGVFGCILFCKITITCFVCLVAHSVKQILQLKHAYAKIDYASKQDSANGMTM